MHVVGQDRFVSAILVTRHSASNISTEASLEQTLRDFLQQNGSAKSAAHAFARSRSGDRQREFYPLICQFFGILGYRCELSRPGVNYQRWDARITLESATLPMEIKSPTEEEMLSIKAVRQALENKIILLSRRGYPTRKESTSLVVGYRVPTERSDMASLIDDIYKAYAICIGVLDLETLAWLAIRTLSDDLTLESTQLETLQGFLHV